MPLKLPDGFVDSQLTPDAAGIVSQASTTMSNWIDTQVNALSSTITGHINDAASGLTAQIKQVNDDITAGQTALSGILTNLSNVKASTDVTALQKAITDAAKAVTDVQTMLQTRQATWTGVGTNIVNLAKTAATKIAAA